MKLRTFDRTNSRNRKDRKGLPIIAVNARGSFSLNKQALILLSLEHENRILIHQDLECRSDWYLEITYEETGFKLGIYKWQVKFASMGTALEIFKSLGTEPKTMRFPIKKRPHTIDGKILYYIITKPEEK